MNELEKRNRMIAEFIDSLGDEQPTLEQTSFLLSIGGSADSTNGSTNEGNCKNDTDSCADSYNALDCVNMKGTCTGSVYNGGLNCVNTGTLQPPVFNSTVTC
ncbi:MAG: hypothetical protein K2J24_10365 [Muribaculaceae bacterium]|nr:hypothetical protein [Bacteroides sp.]MDE6843915.1 hypothetical protein [Muribaculaceae bacterium]